jgi:hypothetical protein
MRGHKAGHQHGTMDNGQWKWKFRGAGTKTKGRTTDLVLIDNPALTLLIVSIVAIALLGDLVY